MQDINPASGHDYAWHTNSWVNSNLKPVVTDPTFDFVDAPTVFECDNPSPDSTFDFVNTPMAFEFGTTGHVLPGGDLFEQFPIGNPTPVLSYNQATNNIFGFPAIPASTVAPNAPLPVAPSVTVPLGQTRTPNGTRFACSFRNNTYKRDKDRKRHEKEKHLANGPHFCQVHGCSNATHGYARKDKLTEHLWKAHADLGFTKRV